MFIKYYNGVLAQNPGYEDIDYIALTKRKDIDTTCFIRFNEKNYRIINVVPSRKFNQLFIRETNENPQKHLYTVTLTGDDCEFTGDGSYTKGTEVEIECIPDEYFAFTGWSDGNTTNPRKITVNEDITLTAITASTLIPLDVPTNLKHTNLSTSNLFRWDAVDNANSYQMELTFYNGELIGTYSSFMNSFTLLDSVYVLPSGDYKFRVKAIPSSSSGYSESEFSDWKVFDIPNIN